MSSQNRIKRLLKNVVNKTDTITVTVLIKCSLTIIKENQSRNKSSQLCQHCQNSNHWDHDCFTQKKRVYTTSTEIVKDLKLNKIDINIYITLKMTVHDTESDSEDNSENEKENCWMMIMTLHWMNSSPILSISLKETQLFRSSHHWQSSHVRTLELSIYLWSNWWLLTSTSRDFFRELWWLLLKRIISQHLKDCTSKSLHIVQVK